MPIPQGFQKIIEKLHKEFDKQKQEEKKEKQAHDKVLLIHEEICSLLKEIVKKNTFPDASKEAHDLLEQISNFENSFGFSQQEIKRFLNEFNRSEERRVGKE